VIISLVFIWYGLIPALGAMYNRRKWDRFKRIFNGLRLKPRLDYAAYSGLTGEGGVFCFTGGFESITDGRVLWVQGDNVTVSVSLENTKIWLLPAQGEAGDDPASFMPEQIRWNRISTVTEGARIFIGGEIKFKDNRWRFAATDENPLMVIFYSCPDKVFVSMLTSAARDRNEYWNSATPLSLAIGAISLIYIAWGFIDRPAYRLTVICALLAMILPLLPWVPPGLLLFAAYRRCAWLARRFRVYSDLARIPLGQISSAKSVCNAGVYGCVTYENLHEDAITGKIPVLMPEYAHPMRGQKWHLYGMLPDGGTPAEGGPDKSPREPGDPFVFFGALPGDPHFLAGKFKARAYIMEAAAWLILLAGIGLNIVFIGIILFMFGVF
jgi:hypothetical protein